jgi:hypothetical protein
LQTGQDWLQALAVIRAQGTATEEFAEVLRAATQHLEGLRGSDPVRWYDLLRIVLTWIWWRRPVAEQQQLLTTVQANRDAAWQRHVQKMREEMGIVTYEEELYLKGQVKTAREWLREALESQHGAVPAELVERIEACADLQKLDHAFRLVLRGRKPEELQL